MILKTIFNKENLFITFLFLFSIIINQYYGNRGVFPPDSFSHFDTGYRILVGEYPFKDYWIVSGPAIDYIQSVFFYFLGINWQIYVFHASLFNGILTIATFLLLRNFNLNIYYSFIYSILFSILAYPASGTPFADLHSAFFSLLGLYSLILAIKNEKKFYWMLFPILFGLAFLSKQVPATYIILSTFFILFVFSIIKKKFYWIKYSSLSTFLFFLFLFFIGYIQNISLSSFLEQYIYYPQTIGDSRIKNFNFTFRGVIDHFKYIYLAFLPLFYVNLKRFFFKKDYIKENNFYLFLCLFCLTFFLITHQLLTKNQTFIFFLIPLLIAFSHISINSYKFNKNIFVSLIMISACFLITIKYHLRFNETRKFHELNYANFKLASEARKIDNRLIGLKWITPEFKDNPLSEIILINEIKIYLQSDQRNQMLITNYSFFSTILNKKLYSPSRWYLSDGTDYPLKNNKYFEQYKNFFIDLIKKNNIEIIYMTEPLDNSIVYNHISKNCINEKFVTKILKSFELKECDELL